MDHLYCDYDENLSENAFFRLLQTEHKIIIDTAPLENWIICVPRATTITATQLADSDFLLAHVLVPHDELPQTHFTNLLGIDLRLERKRLTSVGPANHQRLQQPSDVAPAVDINRSDSSTSTSSSSGLGIDEEHPTGQPSASPTPSAFRDHRPASLWTQDGADGGDADAIESLVLFEEVFYTKQLMKYKVWCIESALIPKSQIRIGDGGSNINSVNDDVVSLSSGNDVSPVSIYVVRNVKDAVEMIWTETRSDVVFRRIDQACTAFCQRPTRADSNNDTFESLGDLQAAIETLYDQCLRLLMQNRRLKEKCRHDVHIYRVVKIALETYMMNVVYERVFDGIALACREEGESFNRMVRRLAGQSMAFFGVDAKHADVAAVLRSELLRIDEYRTTIEKLACLRRSINASSVGGSRTLCVDDVIPIMAYVICKSGIAHWTATQKFVQLFVLNDLTVDQPRCNDKGADGFVATTLEAAMQYIVGLTDTAAVDAGAVCRLPTAQQCSKFSTHMQFVEYFFDAVRRGDEREVLRLFGSDGSHLTVDGVHEDERIVDDGDTYTNDNIDAVGDASESSNNGGILVVETSAEDHAQLCHPLCACQRCASIVRAQQITVNIRNADGQTAMHVAASHGLPKLINVLLALGADVQLTDDNGWTALHSASQHGHQGAVLLLLHAGIDVNARSTAATDLCTALHLASHNGHDGCVKAILYTTEQRRTRVDINCLTRGGDTAVHLAARWGFGTIVETLLEYGVKVDIPNREGRTASQSAHNSVVRELLLNTFVLLDDERSLANVDGSDAVASEPFRGCISEKLMAGSDAGLMDDRENSSSPNDKVIAAIQNDDLNLALYYLGWQQAAADLQAEVCTNNTNSHTSHIPRKYDYSKCSKTTVAPRANIDTFNAGGLTMLLAAAGRKGNAVLVRLLLWHGASVKLRTTSLQSALHLAVKCSDLDMVREVLSVCGDYELNVQDADGNTALHLAVGTGNEEIVTLLLRHEPWLEARNNAHQTAADLAHIGFAFNIAHLLASEMAATAT